MPEAPALCCHEMRWFKQGEGRTQMLARNGSLSVTWMGGVVAHLGQHL